MSNVTIVRISGAPESLYTSVGAVLPRAPSPESESTDASTVTFTSGRVTLKVDSSGSPGLPRRPQRNRRRTQLVHHRDRHLRQEVKVIRYLPSPKAAPPPRRQLSTSDAATCTSSSDVDATPAPSSAASSSSERSSSGGVDPLAPPPAGLRYRLSLAEQYQNQLFTEPSYVISAPAAFAGDWAASSDAHDSGLEGSESEAAPRSEGSSHTRTAVPDRQLTRPTDLTDAAPEHDAASHHSESPAEHCLAGEEESCCASTADDSAYCCAAVATEESSERYTVTSEESGYCYIPAKEQRECSQEVLIVVNERVSPTDFVYSEEEDQEAVPENPGASRKVSAATTVDRHFYFGEEPDRAESEGSTSQGECGPPDEEGGSRLTVHNLRRLEELQSRSALPESFLAFKQALLESGDMSGLRKADLYTVLGGTVRGYPASWHDLGSKFEEADSRSDDAPAADSDSRSGVSIDAWTVDRRGRYRAGGRGTARPACPRRDTATTLAPLGDDSDGWYPLCVRCEDMVYPQDGVRPAADAVYHAACLRCASCERLLGKEEVRAAGRLLFCAAHAPPGATVCQPGSRSGSCASSTDSRQVSTRTAQ